MHQRVEWNWLFDLFRASIRLDRQQSQIWNYFHKRLVLLDACAMCSELPSNISTMIMTKFDLLICMSLKLLMLEVHQFNIRYTVTRCWLPSQCVPPFIICWEPEKTRIPKLIPSVWVKDQNKLARRQIVIFLFHLTKILVLSQNIFICKENWKL